jgi:hypothetical protein
MTTTRWSSGYASPSSLRNASKHSPSRWDMYEQKLSPLLGSTAAYSHDHS